MKPKKSAARATKMHGKDAQAREGHAEAHEAVIGCGEVGEDNGEAR